MHVHRRTLMLERLLYKLMTGVRPLPLLSRLHSVLAGQHQTVTDVGMRLAAKCPSL